VLRGNLSTARMRPQKMCLFSLPFLFQLFPKVQSPVLCNKAFFK
jgi:hypothetical protein